MTEVYVYLRLLYARAGTPRCPDHGVDLAAQTVSQMVDHVLELPECARLMLHAPVVQERKGEHVHLLEELRARGFVRARIDGEVIELAIAWDPLGARPMARCAIPPFGPPPMSTVIGEPIGVLLAGVSSAKRAMPRVTGPDW